MRERRAVSAGPGAAHAKACLTIGALVVLAACSGPPAPLSSTFESEEALAAAVLEAVARRDARTLESYALSEAEFRSRVWPELPASRPERNVPLEYVWGDLSQKSRLHLRQTLARHGGRRYRLVRIGYRGPATSYLSFEVSRKAELIVRDEQGREHALRLFGSVLSAGNRHKLFSFVID